MNALNQALRAIRKSAMYHQNAQNGFGGYRPFFRQLGICSNVANWLERNMDDSEDELRGRLRSRLVNLVHRWERENHISGSCGVYPVGGENEYDSGDLYGNPRRRQLLGYLIRETMK